MSAASTLQRPTGTVSLLFTDIEESTPLLERLGAGAYEKLLREHHHILRDCFAGNGGHEVGTAGDGFLVAFSGATDSVRATILCEAAGAASAAPAVYGVHGERLDATIRAVCQRLGGDGREAAARMGRAMTPDEIVAYALMQIDTAAKTLQAPAA
jgi:class 3 adenylate cyclase